MHSDSFLLCLDVSLNFQWCHFPWCSATVYFCFLTKTCQEFMRQLIESSEVQYSRMIWSWLWVCFWCCPESMLFVTQVRFSIPAQWNKPLCNRNDECYNPLIIGLGSKALKIEVCSCKQTVKFNKGILKTSFLQQSAQLLL